MTAEKAKNQVGVSHNAVVLSLVAVLLLASDCTVKLGTTTTALKIPALVLFAVYGMFLAIKQRVDKKKMVLCLVGTVLLYVEMPFQSALGSYLDQVMFFALIAITVVCAPLILDSKETLGRVFLVSFLFVLAMMIWAIPDIISQLNFYSSTSRLRIKGCFSNPNSLGHVSAFLIVMCIASLDNQPGGGARRKNFSAIVSVVVLLIFVIASGSNTALIEIAAFMLIVYVGKEYSRCSVHGKRLCILLIVATVAVAALALFSWALGQETFRMRLDSLISIDSSALPAVGYGYVSSSGISIITQVAGGVVDMLWVSLIYRVGIVGCFAYLLYFLAASNGAWKGENRWLFAAFLAVVLLQSISESYWSSVMSFVSWFIWVFMSACPTISLKSQFTRDDKKFLNRIDANRKLRAGGEE